MLLLSGMVVCLICTVLLIFNYLALGFMTRNLDQVRSETGRASEDLMVNAYNAMQSDTIKHMVRIQELLDTLSAKNGTLVRYEVQGTKVEWEALIPPAFAQEFGKPEDLAPDGRARVKNTR